MSYVVLGNYGTVRSRQAHGKFLGAGICHRPSQTPDRSSAGREMRESKVDQNGLEVVRRQDVVPLDVLVRDIEHMETKHGMEEVAEEGYSIFGVARHGSAGMRVYGEENKAGPVS
jgi:hypothetical protein